MNTFVKVEGNSSLMRDTSTRAVVNSNASEYQAYMRTKQAMLQRKSETERQAEEINNLKQDIGEIKQMLAMLINSKENNG
jgi:cell shape-determining protein MreC